MSVAELSMNFEVSPYGTITDYKYSHNGQYLAIADSEGYVQVYQKDKKTYVKDSQFRVDEASVWSISWANSIYGNLIGAGTFNNRVVVYQQGKQGWIEIASHVHHEASVNCVEWSPCGLKLYAGSSDGCISVLEPIHNKSWKGEKFTVSQASVISFALQPTPLGEIIASENAQSFYPRIATVTKDHKVTVWVHKSQVSYNQAQMKNKQFNKCGYAEFVRHMTPKETVRSILWRPSWGTMAQSLNKVELIYCTEEGSLKALTLSKQQSRVEPINEGEAAFTKISQSLTGNFLIASTFVRDQLQTMIFEEIDEFKWKTVKEGKL